MKKYSPIPSQPLMQRFLNRHYPARPARGPNVLGIICLVILLAATMVARKEKERAEAASLPFQIGFLS